MAKRRASKTPLKTAAATRATLLQSAATVFSRKGFAAATISDIAEEAGLNRSLISYHFGGKDGLYETLLRDAVAAAVLALQRRRIDPSLSDPETALVQAFSEIYSAQPHLAFMLAREHLEPGYLASAGAAENLRGFIDLTRQALKAAPLSARAATFDPQIIHLIIVGALIYFLITEPYRERMQSLLDEPPTQPSLDEFAATLSHFITKGLRH